MAKYIATFFSHFGASMFKRVQEGMGIKVKLMPVPRSLSSSCGTCALYETEHFTVPEDTDEIEQIVRVDGDAFDSGAYTSVYSQEQIQ